MTSRHTHEHRPAPDDHGFRAVLHREHEGTGVPVLLVHGFPLDHRMWSETVGELTAAAQAPTVLSVDLPGFGDASVIEGDVPSPSVEVMADALASALDAQGVGGVVAAGMSMGGYVVLALLERRPDLVRALALVDTRSSADAAQAKDNRLWIAGEVESTGSLGPVEGMATSLLGRTSREKRPDLVQTVRGWIDDQTPAAVAWAQRAMASRPDRTPVLSAYTGPVSVVVGTEDDVTPPALAEEMVEAASDESDPALVLVPDAGHLAALEGPEHVAGALLRLQARADAAA